jgi:hypothetical protein
MKTHRMLILAAAAFAAQPQNVALASEVSTPCDLHLVVQLTPDVPNPSDPGFLSSLLGNHPSYRLDLRQERDDSTLLLELIGPESDEGCHNVVAAIGKDARVTSIRIEDTVDPQPFVSPTGLGSLYWAAQHPTQAWRILLPQ